MLTICTAGFVDSHSLSADMFARPQVYLNGTTPHRCLPAEREEGRPGGVQRRDRDKTRQLLLVRRLTGWGCHGGCAVLTLGVRDRFDELHPFVRVERVVAKAISDAIHRESGEWITWLQ